MAHGPFTPFHFPTLKEYEVESPRLPYSPIDSNPDRPFDIGDPFGLRKAIVPVFLRSPDGSLLGAGTAFHVDGWGTYLTADHVVDFARGVWSPRTPGEVHQIDPNVSPSAVILLGCGLVFGTVEIPREAFVNIEVMHSVLDLDVENPMPWLPVTHAAKAPFDVACLSGSFAPNAPWRSSLPVCATTWQPSIGEYVLAIGFPQLDFSEVDARQLRALLSEGMKGSYGRIVGIHPAGRSPDSPNPGFEVEADWPPGMSGGPVINAAGEVVGIVSKSVSPTETLPGVGFATWLARVPDFDHMVPMLDTSNSGWRRGFAVFQEETAEMVAVFPTEALARVHCNRSGIGCHVAEVSHRMGTREYMGVRK